MLRIIGKYFLTLSLLLTMFFAADDFVFSQDDSEDAPEDESQNTSLDRQARGSIPEILLRPARGEALRYPVDTVIGELGRGRAAEEVYFFAKTVCEGLLSADTSHNALLSVNLETRQGYLTAINAIDPVNYRIGGGREEADGTMSFLIRFFGKEQGISGELYLRRVSGSWTIDDLLLDDPKDREEERREALERIYFNPYERFF